MSAIEHKLPRDDSVALTFFRVSDAAALHDLDADPEHCRRFEFPGDFVPTFKRSEKVISDWTRARDGGGPFIFAVRAVAKGNCFIRYFATVDSGCAFGWLAHSRNSRLRLFTEDTSPKSDVAKNLPKMSFKNPA